MLFSLHPQLKADCITVGDLPLCRLLLLNDARYIWTILVPRRHKIREIYQLSTSEQVQLLKESSQLGEALMRKFNGDKLNIGALGNMVPQLHIHHIIRHENDPAWPGSVWGHSPSIAYSDEALVTAINAIHTLGLDGFSPASA